MRHEFQLAIIQRLIAATKAKKLVWKDEDEHGWFTAPVGDDGAQIVFRMLYFEATNQIGADPAMFEFSMPGMNGKFAFGTMGANLLFDLLEAAFPEKWNQHDNNYALEFLDKIIG